MWLSSITPGGRGGGGGGGEVTTCATATGDGRDVYVSRVDKAWAVLSATPLRERLGGDYGGTLRRLVALGGAPPTLLDGQPHPVDAHLVDGGEAYDHGRKRAGVYGVP